MTREFLKILQQFFVHIMFGTDVDEELSVTLMTKRSQNDPLTPKKYSLSDAVEEVFLQTFETIAMRVTNPIWKFLYNKTGKCYSFFSLEKVNEENCRILRDKIRDYVRKRVSGKCKSDLGNESDVLSLMLKSPDIFKEEDIIDGLLDFLVAGTQTTQNTAQYAFAHFMTDPTSLARLRTEFDTVAKAKDITFDQLIRNELSLEFF